jgi:hypothetical protein
MSQEGILLWPFYVSEFPEIVPEITRGRKRAMASIGL